MASSTSSHATPRRADRAKLLAALLGERLRKFAPRKLNAMLFPTPSKTPKYRQPSSPSQAMLATVAKERPDGFLSRSHDLLPRELPEELRGALRQREMQRDPEPCSFGVGLGGVAWAAVGCHVYAWNADRPLDGCVRVVGNSEADAALVCAVRWSRPPPRASPSPASRPPRR